MNRTFTTEERLAVVEKCIEDFRWARGEPKAPEHLTFWALKSVADDLRSRLPNNPASTLVEMQELIDAARASKTALGYEAGKLHRIAEFAIGRWPVLKLSLEKMIEGAFRS